MKNALATSGWQNLNTDVCDQKSAPAALGGFPRYPLLAPRYLLCYLRALRGCPMGHLERIVVSEMKNGRLEPKLSVIIAATPRSGSYLLCDLLQATGYLPLADEWLTDVAMEARRMAYGMAADTPWEALLPELLRREQNEAGVFAVKTVWEHFESCVGTAASTAPSTPGEGRNKTLARHVPSVFPHPKFLWIKRRDGLAQAVSRVKAKQTGQWRSGQTGTESRTPKLVFSPHEIYCSIVFANLDNRCWEAFFRESETPVLSVDFEDLIKDPHRSLSEVCAYLSLPAPEALELPGKPQRDHVNDTWIERYWALVRIAESVSPQEIASDRQAFAGEPLNLPERLEIICGAVHIFEIEVRNTGPRPWKPQIGPQGYRGAVLRGSLRPTASTQHNEVTMVESFIGEVTEPVGPGENTSVEVFFQAPETEGDYILQWTLEEAAEGVDPSPPLAGSTEIQVSATPAVAAAKRFFGECRRGPTGWNSVPGFGYMLVDYFPWVFHHDHHWWFIDEKFPDGEWIRIHDVHLGWLRTTRRTYPDLLREEDQSTIRFAERKDELRTFLHLSPNGPITVPTCEQAHIDSKVPNDPDERGLFDR